jgi:hypothetical protein
LGEGINSSVELLWATLIAADHEDLAAKLKNHSNRLPELVRTLSALEREVLDAQVHRAIALLKAAIGGKRSIKEFEQQCLKIQGLL